MKIVFLVSSLGSGGAERVASTLCNSWASSGRSVTLITTYSGGGASFYKIHPNVTLKYLSEEVLSHGKGKNYARRLFVLRAIINSLKPDLVISFLPNVNIAAIAATAFTQIPRVICERSDPVERPIGKIWSLACRWLYRFADAIVVQTDSVASRIGKIYPGLKKVAIIPNPIPVELLQYKPADVGCSNKVDRKLLICVGRLSAEKRHANIIKSFVSVSHAYPDWDLHIVGDGPLREKLQEQIDSAGLSVGRVRLLGRSNKPWELMQSAHAFVMASAYEGFPNALLEAVALGLPSISTNCRSGPQDISDNGRVVKLVPPNDDAALAAAIDELLGNQQLRERLGRDGMEFVHEHFALNVVLNKWNVLLDSVIKRS